MMTDALEDLRHYASVPVTLDARTSKNDTGAKPSGLWVSVGSAWLDWCRDEEFRIDLKWYDHKVTVTSDANILHLANELAMDQFTAEYGEQISSEFPSWWIDWSRVSVDYDGIVIAPYQWSRRSEPHTFWYYGWDCASGCIWNPAVVSLGAAVDVEVSA